MGWLKQRLSGRTPEKIRSRAQRLGTPELLDWADGCVNAVGRSLSEYRRAPVEDAPAWLDNARLESHALLVLLEEAQERLH